MQEATQTTGNQTNTIESHHIYIWLLWIQTVALGFLEVRLIIRKQTFPSTVDELTALRDSCSRVSLRWRSQLHLGSWMPMFVWVSQWCYVSFSIPFTFSQIAPIWAFPRGTKTCSQFPLSKRYGDPSVYIAYPLNTSQLENLVLNQIHHDWLHHWRKQWPCWIPPTDLCQVTNVIPKGQFSGNFVHDLWLTYQLENPAPRQNRTPL